MKSSSHSFQTKNHSLENVNLGQGHFRVPYDECLCADCSVLGDEFHCVFEVYISSYFTCILHNRRHPSMAKLVELLTSTRVSAVNKSAKSLYVGQR